MSKSRIRECRSNILAAALLLGAASIAATAAAPEARDLAVSRAPAPDSKDPAASDRSGEAADTGKSATDGSGRIDGYLAGGRWREGSKLVDMPGQFRVLGDRVAFHASDGKARFACLENLNSERIARIVSESPETLEWVVQGTITEFRNENYLLVTQGVIRNRGTREAHPAGERSPTSSDSTGASKQR